MKCSWTSVGILGLVMACAACGDDAEPLPVDEAPVTSSDPVSVSGDAIHYFSTSTIHSQEESGTEMVQRSTDIIELSGDLEGKTLYHPVSVFDFAQQTLVNTGNQVFSGSVLGSEPMLLHDDQFRFDVDLATGATTGKVYLRGSRDLDQPSWYDCDLDIVGTGMTAEGDALASYTGTCTLQSR